MAITDTTWYLDTPDIWVQTVAQNFPEDFESTVTRALVLDGPTITASGKTLSTAQMQSLLLARGIAATSSDLAAALTAIRNRQIFERTLGATRNLYILAQFLGEPYSQGATVPVTVSAGSVTPASVQSVKGPQGSAGPTGAIGPAGPQGPQGPAGDPADLADSNPLAIGAAAPGTAVEASRADHVHAHGDQAGGTLHVAATTGLAGFMSAADKTKLDGIEAGATATPLSDAAPASVVTATPLSGVSTSASRSDHQHAHGDLDGGTLHAIAVPAVSAGFMSSSWASIVEDISNTGWAAVLAQGNGSGANDAVVNAGQTIRVDGTISALSGTIAFASDFSVNVASPTITIGTGVGSTVVVLDKLATNSSTILWRDAGVTRWVDVADGSANRLWQRHDASGVLVDTPLYIAGSSGIVNVAGVGRLGVAGTSNIITLGDGTSTSLGLYLRGATSTDKNLIWQQGAGNFNTWIARGAGATHNWELNRRNPADGTSVDIPIRVYSATGDIDLANDVHLPSGDLYFAVGGGIGIDGAAFATNHRMYFREATVNAIRMDAVLNTDRSMLEFFGGPVSVSRQWTVLFDGPTRDLQWSRYIDGTFQDFLMTFDNSSGDVLFANNLAVGGYAVIGDAAGTQYGTRDAQIAAYGRQGSVRAADTTTDATNKTARFETVHYTNAEEPFGIILGTCTSGAAAVSIGGGSTIANAATQISLYAATNTTTLGSAAGIEQLRVSNGSVTLYNGATLLPQTNGSSDIGSTGVRIGTIFSNDQEITDFLELNAASTPATPGANETRFFSDTSDGRAKIVDSDGSVKILGIMPPQVFTVANVERDSAGAPTGDGTNTGAAHNEDATPERQYLTFLDSTTNVAVWTGYLPETYSGKGLVFEFLVAGSTGSATNATFQVSIERLLASAIITSNSFDAANSVSVTMDATAGRTSIGSGTLTNIDSLAAGEFYRIRVVRPTGDAYGGEVRFYRGVLREVV